MFCGDSGFCYLPLKSVNFYCSLSFKLLTGQYETRHLFSGGLVLYFVRIYLFQVYPKSPNFGT